VLRRLVRFDLAWALLVLVFPVRVLANIGGVPGYSGNPDTDLGQTCNVCHNPGSAPIVSLGGPTTIPGGETRTYLLTIQRTSTNAHGPATRRRGGNLYLCAELDGSGCGGHRNPVRGGELRQPGRNPGRLRPRDHDHARDQRRRSSVRGPPPHRRCKRSALGGHLGEHRIRRYGVGRRRRNDRLLRMGLR
jgi:hypothetical protein